MKTYFYITGVLCVIVLVKCKDGTVLENKIEECAKEVLLSNESFDEVVNLKMPDFGNSKFRCILACMFKKSNRMKDGKLSLDNEIDATKNTSPDESEDSRKEKVTECVNKGNEEKEDCDVAGVYLKCLYEKLRPKRK